MIDAEILDLTSVCRSFPMISDPQVHRENFLNTIDTIFEGDTQLLVVEGEDGLGKTTLLTQFAKKYPNQTFSLFIKPTSRWAYDPAYLRSDLCCQIYWLLKHEELHDLTQIDDGFLRTSLYQLQRFARQRAFFFIVDGLTDIPENETQVQESILNLLPFGLSGFRFLLTGNFKHFSSLLPKGLSTNPLFLTPFTLDETIKYMEDITDDRNILKEIYHTCKGVPGSLASIRRILQSGASLQDLVDDLPSQLPQLFEIEWQSVKQDDEQLLSLLAILAYGLERHSTSDLARITSINEFQVQNLLQPLGFLNFVADEEISFTSELFRKFAAGRLLSWKEQVTNLLIDDLLRNPETTQALTFLPGYLTQAERYDELLTYLSPATHLTKILEQSHSLGPVRRLVDLGISTALQLHRNEDLMRFCVQRTIMDDFDGAEIWRSEVEAHMALHDYNAAIALAQGTEIKEERLHLLAVIAKMKREQGEVLDPALIEQMRQLYSQIDQFALNAEKAADIASDLIYSLPELAIELVEKAIHTDKDPSTRDWAFAKVTLAVSLKSKEPFLLSSTLEDIRSRIAHPVARHLSRAMPFLFQEASAKEVVEEIATFEAIDRLNLFRFWIKANYMRTDAIEVVDVGLRLMIQTTEYSPNARVLRELAEPLPFASDASKVKQLIGIFDSQKDLIEKLGPTYEYVILQLLLADAERNYEDDFGTVRNRLIEIYFYICDIDDLVVKTQCIARLASLLMQIDPQQILEDRDKIHSAALNDLQDYTHRLLLTTADHYSVTRETLLVLAKTYPEKSLELATALNTEPRRDAALIDVLTSALQTFSVEEIDWHFISQILALIINPGLVDKALVIIVSEFFEETDIKSTVLVHLIPFFTRVKDIQDAEMRCRACSLAYVLLTKHDISGQYTSLSNSLLEQIHFAWDIIDEGWSRVNAGFELVKTLADSSFEIAETFMRLTEEFKNNILLEMPSRAQTYLTSLNLAIRAYCGLLPQNIVSENDKQRIANFINHIPSRGSRIMVWADLALRNYIYKHAEEGKRIINIHIKPLLETLRETDRASYNSVMPFIASVLYRLSPLATLESLALLPQPYRESAYMNICLFILSKLPFGEPCDIFWEQGYELTYEEIVELCTLLLLIEDDAIISNFIKQITDSVMSGRRRGRFSKQQQQDVIDRLKDIIRTKLPNPRYIQHEGYRIASYAQIARLERAKLDAWFTLVDEARGIPNIADKALVLSILGVTMPKENSRYREILKEAEETVESIPVFLEKMRKYEHLASLVLSMDSSLSKRYIELAMNCTHGHSDLDAIRQGQKNLIDLAYRLDPDYAALLASRMDDDPAKRDINNYMTSLTIKSEIDDINNSNFNNNTDIEEYSQAAWMALKALNAKRMGHVHIENTLNFLRIASGHPLEQTYPIFAWVIQNAVNRFAQTDLAKTILRSIYDATLLGIGLVEKMDIRASDQIKRTKTFADASSINVFDTVIHAGERDVVLQMLRTWFESEVRDYLLICDAFFGPEDLSLLKLLKEANPGCEVSILTSAKYQLKQKISTPWEDAYRDYWRVKISDQRPPSTTIVIVGTQTKHESPVHDRWWLTKGSGLRVGTSFNSLGITKLSEISKLSSEIASLREIEIKQYIQRPYKQEHERDSLLYTIFKL